MPDLLERILIQYIGSVQYKFFTTDNRFKATTKEWLVRVGKVKPVIPTEFLSIFNRIKCLDDILQSVFCLCQGVNILLPLQVTESFPSKMVRSKAKI